MMPSGTAVTSPDQGADRGRGERPGAFVLGGGLATLSLVRSLGRHGIPITVFTDQPDDITFRSRYVRAVRLGRPYDENAAVERLIAEADKEHQKPVLFVTGDVNLLAACRHADRLQQHVHLLLPALSAAETVVQKERFRDFSLAHDVPVPKGWHPSTLDELRTLIPQMRFPVVLKPVSSSEWQQASMVAVQGHIKMVRVDSPEQLLAQWSRISASCTPPLLQEYILGDDSAHYSYQSYRGRDGRELASLCIQKLRLKPIHGGLAAFARVVRDPAMEESGRRLLDQLGYRSVASVCFKRDAVTGEASIFEVNGRLPLSHGMFSLAGMDLPWLMYRDALGLPCEPLGEPRASGYWVAITYDVSAANEYRRAGELDLWEWLRSLLKVRMVVEFDPRDPGPFFHVTRRLIRQALRGLRG